MRCGLLTCVPGFETCTEQRCGGQGCRARCTIGFHASQEHHLAQSTYTLVQLSYRLPHMAPNPRLTVSVLHRNAWPGTPLAYLETCPLGNRPRADHLQTPTPSALSPELHTEQCLCCTGMHDPAYDRPARKLALSATNLTHITCGHMQVPCRLCRSMQSLDPQTEQCLCFTATHGQAHHRPAWNLALSATDLTQITCGLMQVPCRLCRLPYLTLRALIPRLNSVCVSQQCMARHTIGLLGNSPSRQQTSHRSPVDARRSPTDSPTWRHEHAQQHENQLQNGLHHGHARHGSVTSPDSSDPAVRACAAETAPCSCLHDKLCAFPYQIAQPLYSGSTPPPPPPPRKITLCSVGCLLDALHGIERGRVMLKLACAVS